MNERAKNKIVLIAISCVCLALAVLISIGAISDIRVRLNPSAFVVPPSDSKILTAVVGVLLSLVMSVMSAIAALSNKFYDKILEKSPSSESHQIDNAEIVAPELDNTLESGRIYISNKDRPLCWVIAVASAVVAIAIGYVCFTQFADDQRGLYTSISPIFLILVIPFFIIFLMVSVFFFMGAISHRFFDSYLKNYFDKK